MISKEYVLTISKVRCNLVFQSFFTLGKAGSLFLPWLICPCVIPKDVMSIIPIVSFYFTVNLTKGFLSY